MSERRRAEIAEKRARLAALKQARQDREQSTRQQLDQLSASATPPLDDTPPGLRSSSRIGATSKTDEIESLLRGVGVASSPSPQLATSRGGESTPERSNAGEERSESRATQVEILVQQDQNQSTTSPIPSNENDAA